MLFSWPHAYTIRRSVYVRLFRASHTVSHARMVVVLCHRFFFTQKISVSISNGCVGCLFGCAHVCVGMCAPAACNSITTFTCNLFLLLLLLLLLLLYASGALLGKYRKPTSKCGYIFDLKKIKKICLNFDGNAKRNVLFEHFGVNLLCLHNFLFGG